MKGSKKQPHPPEFSVPGVDLGQLERLLSFMSEHGLEEFEYAHGDLRIRLKKAITQPSAPPTMALPAAPAAPTGALRKRRQSVAPPAAVPGPVAAPAQPPQDQHIIKSPIVGTFYAGPNPDATVLSCVLGTWWRPDRRSASSKP